MVQVERHIVRRGDHRYGRIDHVCWLSKNLYNAGIFVIKQEFLRSGKWIRWIELNKQFLSANNVDYRALSAWSSNNILHRLDQNLKGYFSSIKAWKRDNKKFTGCPRFTRYKDKTNGRFSFVYSSQMVRLVDGMLHFPKKEGFAPLRTRVTGGIRRGLFRSGSGMLINADVNGSVNILRKAFGDDVALRCLVNRGHVSCPVRVCADKVAINSFC